MTTERPFSSIPARPSICDRSTSCDGDASRSFIVGVSVWPPASSLASSFLARRLDACRTVVGRWKVKAYIEISLLPAALRRRLLAAHRRRAGSDRFHDVVVAGAAADVAFEFL